MLGSVTLTWYQVFVIAAAVAGFYALEAWCFLRAARKQAEHEAAGRSRLEELAAEIAALREQVAGLSTDVSSVRRAPQSSGQYREAVEMAEQGLDAAAVAENCGISRAEADLIVALYRSRAA
jgi:hypothetical protein